MPQSRVEHDSNIAVIRLLKFSRLLEVNRWLKKESTILFADTFCVVTIVILLQYSLSLYYHLVVHVPSVKRNKEGL